MKNAKRTVLIVCILIVAFSITAFAATEAVNAPTLMGSGGIASCKARITYSGQSIDATLELYQGSTLITSWHKTGSSVVSFSETENYTSGLSYTLTISGTVNGIDFTPQSVTKTLW